MRARRILGLLAAVLPAIDPMAARADSWDGVIPAFHANPGDAVLDINGLASGAVFTNDAHGGQNASGAVKISPRLHRDYDSGLSLGLDATFTQSDVLSRGRYGGDVIEKAFGDVRTGLGRLEIGQTDGAAYDLSVTGPKVDDQVSLDNPQTTFFRDPSTKHAFPDIFTLRTQIGASSNFAKLAYLSPALFGVQLAMSFTPNQAHDGLPFLHEGPHVADRQADIWEGALKYSDEVGPLTVSAYGGGAFGRAEHKLPGQEGVSDLGAGVRAEYPVNDDLTLSIGEAFRQSNDYAFQAAKSFQAGTTRALQASASATYDAWIAGVEYGDGNAASVAGAPRLELNGYQASVGYVWSSSIQVTTGWQKLIYDRSSGIFYNGAPRIGLDAAFLHLNLKTSG